MRVIQCLNACSIKIQSFDPFSSRLGFNRAIRDFIERGRNLKSLHFY